MQEVDELGEEEGLDEAEVYEPAQDATEVGLPDGDPGDFDIFNFFQACAFHESYVFDMGICNRLGLKHIVVEAELLDGGCRLSSIGTGNGRIVRETLE
jgi:hypothetical protein